MRQSIIILLLSISNIASAQNTVKVNSWIIKANATSLIDELSFPTVQLSAEKKLNEDFSLSLETGYQFYSTIHPDTVFLNPKGFKINMEFRFYLSKYFRHRMAHCMRGFYIGIQPFYRQNLFTSSMAYYTKNDTLNSIVDYFAVKNFSYGINCMLGFQRSVSKKITMELYLGLGYINRKVQNTELEYNEDAGDYYRGHHLVPLLYHLSLSKSSGPAANMSFGFRIGYKF